MVRSSFSRVLLIIVIALTAGCASRSLPPSTHNNICSIIDHDDGWFEAAHRSYRRWGTPIGTQLAFVRQESSFRHNARPPQRFFLGFIPLGRASSAYGFAQALDGTWDDYRRDTQQLFASRSRKEDALDFIGWYNQQSLQRNQIALNDPYNQYLNYHEGHGGFRRQTYLNKAWLLDVAARVEAHAITYQQQLESCPQSTGICIWPFCR